MKLVRIFALILTALILAGCTGTPTDPETPSTPTKPQNTSDFFLVEVDDPLGTLHLYKIDTNTGAYTNICDDPLCRHTSDECLFYNAGGSFEECGNMVYFLHGNDGSDWYSDDDGKVYYSNLEETLGLFSCDLTTGKLERIIGYDDDHPDDFPNTFYPTGKDIFYFTHTVTGESEETAPNGGDHFPIYQYTLCRIDVETKEIKTLHTLDEDEPEFYLSDYDDTTLTWIIGRERVVTDYDFNEISREAIEKSVGDSRLIVYNGRKYYAANYPIRDEFGAVLEENKPANLYLMNESGGEDKLIIENLGNFSYVPEKDIFVFTKDYGKTGQTKIYPSKVNHNGQAIYDTSKGEIWRVNADGTDERLICKVEDTNLERSFISGFYRRAGAKVFTNDCILVEMKHLWYNPQGSYDPDLKQHFPGVSSDYLGGYAIVNVETGDCKVVYPDGDPQLLADHDLSQEYLTEPDLSGTDD